MLTKKQKTWMWIFAAIFMVPEILWGNLTKILGISFLPIYKDVQIFTDNPILAFLVIFLEIIGTAGIFYLLNKKNAELTATLKTILNTILIIIFLVLLVSLYLSLVTSQISFP